MDVTHVPCGRDGWAHLAAVIGCHDREVIGYEFALRCRSAAAESVPRAGTLAFKSGEVSHGLEDFTRTFLRGGTLVHLAREPGQEASGQGED